MPGLMTYQVYNVPIVPPDLRREETVKQIADALDYLEKVSNDVFTKINKRVEENRAKLQNINDRLSLAQAKVDKLKGSNKATKVFASAKFPATEDLEEYSSAFKSSRESNIQSPKRSHYRIQSKHQIVDNRILRDKLQYYNVHLNVKRKKKAEDEQGEGLGGLPRNIPSVSSLLLFNTSENPYKKYVMLDPLGVVTKTRMAIEEEEAGMADAPSTITQQEELRRQQDNYFYMPDIGQVPEIMVPDFLPDLLGVADDVSYSADQGPSIAPSVLGTGAVPDLPDLVNAEHEAIPSGPAGPGGPTDTAPPPPGPPPPNAPPPPAAPPPPPPPPPPGVPPPPPPPPPPAPTDDADSSPTAASTEATSSGGGHSDLLASIRNAGGAGKMKLRSAKDRKIEKKKQQDKSTGGGGGDLMSDLFAKLTMRRKGISGTGKGGGGGGGGGGNDTNDSPSLGGSSAMDKISSMIPSPPKPGGEDDGDDEETWD